MKKASIHWFIPLPKCLQQSLAGPKAGHWELIQMCHMVAVTWPITTASQHLHYQEAGFSSQNQEFEGSRM